MKYEIKTIDSITNELIQLFNSAHRLKHINKHELFNYCKEVSTINHEYTGKLQIKKLEDVYSRIKFHEKSYKIK